ncbi:LysE/ArgO family amino acid transporter [Amycolatopsis australiensis]|uniref:Arginine exporter protein ArgO n=1 Tax=Amycolatopsis australiensis TaxID=546364 RepID=A0A1K1SIA3_9PSEU|nr:LysE family transporter [Amycolatopsis australiensis]SFW83876.1 Arginine exporter protein ArgO [Amycolatopsis australiensis]
MTGALLAGLVAGYGIAIPVGAVGAYLVALTARTSLRTGLAAALGVATADGVYALVAVLGGAAAAGVVAPVAVPLRLVSAGILVLLAVRGAVSALRSHRDATARPVTPLPPGRAYAGLLGVTLVNPATVVYFAALVVGGRAGAAVSVPEQAAFVLAAFTASASWQALLAGGGALLGRVLTGPRGRLVTTLLSSAVITAIAVRLVLS